MIKQIIVLLAHLFNLNVTAQAQPAIGEIHSIREVLAVWKELKSSFEESQILVVFDVDSTLVKQVNALGSEPWFSWQEDILKTNPENSPFKNYHEMLRLTDIFRVCMSTIPTEPSTVRTINKLIHSQSPVIALTSRGANLDQATERELTENNIQITDSKAQKFEYRGLPELPNLSAGEKDKFKLNENQLRTIEIRNNVIYSTGLHKGGILKSYFQKFGKDIRAIIFVDDSKKQVDRVYDAFIDSDVRVVSTRYTFPDQLKMAFDALNKEEISSAMKNYEPCPQAHLLGPTE